MNLNVLLATTFIRICSFSASFGQETDRYLLSNPNASGAAVLSYDHLANMPAIVFSNEIDYYESISWEESRWRQEFPDGVSVLLSRLSQDNFLGAEKFLFEPQFDSYTFATNTDAALFASFNPQSSAFFLAFVGGGDWLPPFVLPTGELLDIGTKVIAMVHYEIRDFFNNPIPPVVSTPSTTPGWTELPPSQSVFHDNGTGLPERKFVHVDGREAVYDGDTGQVVTDPAVAGTYNYVNPGVAPDHWYDVGGWTVFVVRGTGHVVVDVLPYLVGGNRRPPGLQF